MYFDPSQVVSEGRGRRYRGRGEDVEPGIGIAWCAGDTTSLLPISNFKLFHELRAEKEDFNEQVLRQYIDAFLSDEEEYDFIRPSRSIKNPSIVDYVLAERFVIERSPPDLLNLKTAITKTNLPVWIGTYMGWSVVPEHSVLLFISVPGGIIIVSSAVGLANALSSGLGTSVKKLFQNKQTVRSRPKK
ncbi:hypothetical protein Q8W71_28830 [Methylobacterium sp. NEAU 140]|uniref:hypothetical protein n=1 Tax=Methylobacterium sp. NEAU 140 TaxID=3064945 RepID=UPI0027371BE2|nr:hypothetical protein [Methylobacterium sp. NEAU 140]MDP4026618.1 hypothetical protein [Methylobacterium sp. NEAU 140]